MQDFIRIGGPVTSSPLNENFRRLLNAIDIANTNLVFPNDGTGIVDTIEDMEALKESGNLVDGQVCYVVSSGEFYRYSAGDNQWHKIMDIGQTFRQGFLNSGLVVMDGKLVADGDSIIIPQALIYFKNQPGDGRYLKGMYRFDGATVDIPSTANGTYSIFIDCEDNVSITTGMPSTDNVNNVFLGTYIVNNNHLYKLYTLPDIAYTADRGHFFIDGGQVSGLNLAGFQGAKVSRNKGYYYDEGINYTCAPISSFPATTDNGSNYNLKSFEAIATVGTLYYMYPKNSFNYPITESTTGLQYNKWVNNGTLSTVPNGHYTIQRHLVTSNGEDFIVYGDTVYNSMADAMSHINDPFGLDVEFPYVEATRMVIGTNSAGAFDVADPNLFAVITLGRLSQVGTFTPEFADNAFKIYSALDDITPATMRFNLLNLENDDYHGVSGFNLAPLGKNDIRKYFALTSKFVDINVNPINVTKQSTEARTIFNSVDGYELADNRDLVDLRNRVDEIEKEIWQTYQNNKEIYEQSLRYRASTLEHSLDSLSLLVDGKVDKTTKINGYTLDRDITLHTDDISEQAGATNLWYTDARVNANSHVSLAYNHTLKTGHGTVSNSNPHGMSTDDITTLVTSNHQFVTIDELGRIQNLPENTAAQLNEKIGPIPVGTIEGDPLNIGPHTNLGNVTAFDFYTNGANITVNNGIATVECVGQLTPENVLTKAEFATHAASRPDLYGGVVDRALTADGVTILNRATPSQYYGTNKAGTPGVFDLPIYVSTASAEEYLSVDEKQFVPIKQSVMLEHLANSYVSYPAASEEAKTGTNMYDLVTKHYHKVYNSGLQGPYINGTQTQDVSAITYGYKVPSDGLEAGTYYFSCDNDNFEFIVINNIAATKELIYTPSTGQLMIDNTELSIMPVRPQDVDETKWLPFVSKTNWNKINEWNFGNNLTVTVTDGRATINADVAGSGAANFVNLGDVNVTYNDNNIGKMIVLDKINGEYKLTWGVANMAGLMRTIDYVGPEATETVHFADYATTASNANTLQNTYSVNDSLTSATTLWTSSKIVQEINKGVKTYSGTTEPSASLGKDGDLYILLEE